MATIDKAILQSAKQHGDIGIDVPYLAHCYPTVNYVNSILSVIANSPVGLGFEAIAEKSKVPKFTTRILVRWLEKDAQLIIGKFDKGIKFYVLIDLTKPYVY